jgi:hemoglobin
VIYALSLLLAAQADPAAAEPPAAPVDWDKEFGVERAKPDPVTGELPIIPYDQSDANAGAGPFHGTAMTKAFGGQDGIHRIADRLVELSQADPRTKDIFASHDMIRLRRTLFEQFCYILNAGCGYSGRTMEDAHRDLGLQRRDLNALVENLQQAMREARVPFAAQNRFLAKLAPMDRDVVVR